MLVVEKTNLVKRKKVTKMAKGESYTNEVAYLTYEEAVHAALDGKERVKTLRKEWEKAGERAKERAQAETRDMDWLERSPIVLAAIRKAIAPYREEIARVEEEIKKNYAIADENYDIWQGLK
jgi:hypothetical protein